MFSIVIRQRSRNGISQKQFIPRLGLTDTGREFTGAKGPEVTLFQSCIAQGEAKKSGKGHSTEGCS